MKKILLIFVLGLFAGNLYCTWQEDFFECLLMPDKKSSEIYLNKILKTSPKWDEVYDCIQKQTFQKLPAGKFELKYNKCTDGKVRPWVLYIPESYDYTKEFPAMVILHGGVSRKELKKEPLKYVKDNYFVDFAEKEGWFLIFPFGQGGATWWDSVGMDNIHDQIITVKKDYNIDDDRVWIEGFSDGASAAFLYAMINPTPYGAFVALNGHMGVGSLDAKLDTYAVNFINSNIYAVTTDKDGLYPTEKMRPTLDMALSTGGNILYRNLSGEHNFSYSKTEIPRIVRFLKRHPRNPHPAHIIWESSSKEFGRCKWLQITSVKLIQPQNWHIDHNATMSDSRITVGFFPNQSYSGLGIKIDGLSKGETLANKCGIKKDDILIKADKIKIKKMDDLDLWKKSVNRGSKVAFVVKRGKKTIELAGKIPEVENYYIFARSAPSGRIDAVFSGNRFRIATSRVGSFSIYIHPDQINLEKKVEIIVDGEIRFSDFIKPDLKFMIENYIENRDRKLVYIARIDITM